MSYVRVAILGQMTGGEVWSVNPTYDPTNEWGDTVDQSALDATAAAIAALTPGTALLGMMSTLLQITGCRLEVRNDANDGLIGISTAMRTSVLPGTGTVGLPPQAAQVFSLRTNTPGGSGRGRIYWPLIGSGLATTGRIPSGNVTTNLAGMKVYLTAIRDALAAGFPTVGFNLAVRSRTTKTTPHVVRIQAGDVVDTQRRRRDNFAENYQVLNFP